MSNYHSFDPNTVTYHHVCELCGKKFQDHHNRTKFCSGPHYRTCEAVIDGKVCGKRFKLKNATSRTRTCCRSHSAILTHTKASDAARSESIKNSEEFKESMKKRSDYLDEHPEKDTRAGSERFKDNLINKYGTTNTSSLDKVKRKRIETTRSRYGVDYDMQNPAIKKRWLKSVTRNKRDEIAMNNEINRQDKLRKRYVRE